MQTKEIELYVEKIRSGIEVSGTIDNEYVELRYHYILHKPSDLEGHYQIVEGDAPSIVRTYGELCGRNLETDNCGNWKNTGRSRITDDMYVLLGVVEEFLNERKYIIIE